MGNEFDFIQALHEQLDRKENPAIGPHLEFAGIIDGSDPSALGGVLADTPAQALAWVEKYKAAGARQIKIYSSVKPETVKAIARDAQERGMTVPGHIPDGMTAIEGVNDGMDQINHISFETVYFHPLPRADEKPDPTKLPVLEADGPRARELIECLKAHHTIVDPTVARFEISMHTEPLNHLEPGIDHLAPQLREARNSPVPPADQIAATAAWYHILMATPRTLHAAGTPIVAGSDQESRVTRFTAN